MSCRKHPGSHSCLHGFWQAQQTNRVTDLRSGSADARRKLLLSDAKVTHELLICRRFFKRIQFSAVQVFEQCVAEHMLVFGAAHNCWNVVRPARLLARKRRSPIMSW